MEIFIATLDRIGAKKDLEIILLHNYIENDQKGFCFCSSAACCCSRQTTHFIITCERNQVDGCCVCRNNCTYCGGGIEDNYPPAGIAAAIFLFPIGIALCCILKERQCVKCNRTCAWEQPFQNIISELIQLILISHSWSQNTEAQLSSSVTI